MAWWWLSFTDPERPEGSQFLGVAIVDSSGGEADAFGLILERRTEVGATTAVIDDQVSSVAAIRRAHDLGINPGGEVAAWLLPDDAVPEERWRNRLLTKAEAEAAQAPASR